MCCMYLPLRWKALGHVVLLLRGTIKRNYGDVIAAQKGRKLILTLQGFHVIQHKRSVNLHLLHGAWCFFLQKNTFKNLIGIYFSLHSLSDQASKQGLFLLLNDYCTENWMILVVMLLLVLMLIRFEESMKCTMRLSPFNNCIKEICPFDPILQLYVWPLSSSYKWSWPCWTGNRGI